MRQSPLELNASSFYDLKPFLGKPLLALTLYPEQPSREKAEEFFSFLKLEASERGVLLSGIYQPPGATRNHSFLERACLGEYLGEAFQHPLHWAHILEKKLFPLKVVTGKEPFPRTRRALKRLGCLPSLQKEHLSLSYKGKLTASEEKRYQLLTHNLSKPHRSNALKRSVLETLLSELSTTPPTELNNYNAAYSYYLLQRGLSSKDWVYAELPLQTSKHLLRYLERQRADKVIVIPTKSSVKVLVSKSRYNPSNSS